MHTAMPIDLKALARKSRVSYNTLYGRYRKLGSEQLKMTEQELEAELVQPRVHKQGRPLLIHGRTLDQWLEEFNARHGLHATRKQLVNAYCGQQRKNRSAPPEEWLDTALRYLYTRLK